MGVAYYLIKEVATRLREPTPTDEATIGQGFRRVQDGVNDQIAHLLRDKGWPLVEERGAKQIHRDIASGYLQN